MLHWDLYSMPAAAEMMEDEDLRSACVWREYSYVQLALILQIEEFKLYPNYNIIILYYTLLLLTQLLNSETS